MKKLLLASLLLAGPALADEGYRSPSPELVKLVDAPVTPSMSVDRRRRTLLFAERRGFRPIAELSRPELKLAGLRFNPENRASGRADYAVGLSLRPLLDKSQATRKVSGLPANARLATWSWAPDGQKLAVVQLEDSEAQLWLVDVASARASQVQGVRLNGTTGFTLDWLEDSSALVTLAVPAGLGAAPQVSPVPDGPLVQEHRGGKASARTYQDLLKSPADEKLFEHYLTSQVVRVSADGSKVDRLTAAGLYAEAEVSPDGAYLLVGSFHRPYSYTLPLSSFPYRSEVLDRQGKSVRVVRDLPLEENQPPDNDAVRPGRRALGWRADAPSTLFWVEAQDGGDARRASEIRDQLFLWKMQEAEPRPWIRLSQRFQGISWGDGGHALVEEGWWKTRRTRMHRVQPDHPEQPAAVVIDRSSEDRYSDPGSPVYGPLADGGWGLLLAEDGKSIFLNSPGASAQGERPALNRLNLETGQIQEVFRSQSPWFERPFSLLDREGKRFLTMRESRQQPANLALHESDRATPLTDFPHPAPELDKVQKEILRYKRADGVELTGTLYTPPGYDPARDGRLPLFVWAYPGEIKNAAVAGQVRDSADKFVRPFWGGPLFFALKGYAVLENPTFPIIGEGKQEPNDTYIPQLIMDAQAAVDAVVAKGVADRDRCAIGGHSYGAFTTANLLAHSDIFRAGIARSGAYNRTLTPFGFQSEERTYWEVPDIYTKMSPFTYADKIDEPLLLIHGAEDANPGTFPVQSERLFQAVKGLGGQVRWVVLPKESHGYSARESVLHTLYEMESWLDQHVKRAGPRRPR